MDRQDSTFIPEACWHAITTNDSSFDGVFYYGVQTTGIFCRPSCKSRLPLPENIRIFSSAKDALAKHFRPCKRCRPDQLVMPEEKWVEELVNWIDCHLHRKITLNDLAEVVHVSPYHLQRTFKRKKGKSPQMYIRDARMEMAKEYLETTGKSIENIGAVIGLKNTAYFIALFKEITNLTPAAYRVKYKRKEALS
ncbi:bifunctional transcriptional activator/DNA repair enzyme AdaA [Sediminibacillus halophilus]|uniref:AraC family transcriptional regulator, regulatory protein of adaptative response / methylphosphotriester-DNA alkyltransferase methyltransferase n=1 Tax=Sediminibacillus halophilus TaxID=482461 RepID=A0A1G9NIB8_9BACI|nr:bifunctional transcriptional activator/DNA repair enzyme AdaA [Sediminibacillus halophilus]SDL86338.1 AraC family transcriptional regulator, regulatory protein of adaptative response / methylphosphotriester-DNA alkyltransferase methyltransferase [Sediminibacillus halophilus]